jgi:hypothetical protein
VGGGGDNGGRKEMKTRENGREKEKENRRGKKK